MRSAFPGYFPIPDTRSKQVWSTGLVVLDANVLLNLYQFSDEARKDFVKVLSTFGDRLWVPHHAIREFLRNRLRVISQQADECNRAIKALNAAHGSFREKRHPTLPPKLRTRFDKVFKDVRKHVETQERTLRGRRTGTDDEVLRDLESLVSGKIGEPIKDLAALYREGDERYKKKIPPGFEDGEKAARAGEEAKYGDLVIWKEILAKAAVAKRDVIFVTEERKVDWWRKDGDNLVGPRPELIDEFTSATGQVFAMYLLDMFLEQAGKHRAATVSASTLEEAKGLVLEFEPPEGNSNFGDVAREFERHRKDMIEVMAQLKGLQAPIREAFDLEDIRKIAELSRVGDTLKADLASIARFSELLRIPNSIFQDQTRYLSELKEGLSSTRPTIDTSNK